MRGSRTWTACIAVAVLVACNSRVPAVQAPSAPPPIAPGPIAATETTIRIGPMTPRDADRITPSDLAAIEAIGNSGAEEPEDGHGHTHEAHLEVPLLTGEAVVFAEEWLTAQRSIGRFDTIAEIKALGYVRSSAPIAGIGSHWVMWPKLAEPFDPAWPAMVLFDEAKKPAKLVGYSYWLQSATEPEGFAGLNDQWHQHQGLCVVNGWVDRERATGPDACAGTYFAGGDLWMLHAWPVAGYESNDGNFSTFNSKLCPAAVGVPDLARCPD